MRHTIGTQSIPPFDRIASTFAALVIVGLVAFLLIRNQPIPDPRLFFALRVVLSLSAATLGASIPDFFNLRWSGGGLMARAGGALALFVLTFVYTPNLVENQGAGSGGGLSIRHRRVHLVRLSSAIPVRFTSRAETDRKINKR